MQGGSPQPIASIKIRYHFELFSGGVKKFPKIEQEIRTLTFPRVIFLCLKNIGPNCLFKGLLESRSFS